MSKIRPIPWDEVPKGTEPAGENDRILVFQNGTFRWMGKKEFQGIQGEPFKYSDFTAEQLAGLKGEKGDIGFDLESELQKFNAYPSQNGSNNCNTSIQIINHSDHITAENGYSLAWQVYAPKKMRNQNIPDFGRTKPNFWCTITGQYSNSMDFKFQNTFLSPVKDDLSSRLLIRDLHSVRIHKKSRGAAPTRYDNKFRAALEIKGLGRKIIKKYTKYGQGSEDINSFSYGKGIFANFSVTVPVRLALIASKKTQSDSAIFLDNIRTVKVCWTGWCKINEIDLRGENTYSTKQFVGIGI